MLLLNRFTSKAFYNSIMCFFQIQGLQQEICNISEKPIFFGCVRIYLFVFLFSVSNAEVNLYRLNDVAFLLIQIN